MVMMPRGPAGHTKFTDEIIAYRSSITNVDVTFVWKILPTYQAAGVAQSV
jgi:hypothetical protein